MEKGPDDAEPNQTQDEMRSEYDLTTLRVRRFRAEREHVPALTVALNDDVARVSTTQEAVNHALRALIAAMPPNP